MSDPVVPDPVQDDVDTHEFPAVTLPRRRAPWRAIVVLALCAASAGVGYALGRWTPTQPSEPLAEIPEEPAEPALTPKEVPPPGVGKLQDVLGADVQVEPAELTAVVDFAAAEKLDGELLCAIRMLGFDLDDIKQMVRVRRDTSFTLGEIMALRGLMSRGDPRLAGRVKQTLTAQKQWGERAEAFLGAGCPPLSWEDIGELVTRGPRYEKVGVGAAQLLKARKRLTWGEIDRAAGYAQQAAIKFDDVAQLMQLMSEEDIQRLVTPLRSGQADLKTLLDLQGRFEWEGASEMLAISRESKVPLAELCKLLEGRTPSQLRLAFDMARRAKITLQEVLKLQAGRSWDEVKQLLDHAVALNTTVERLAELRKTYGWTDIDLAQRVAAGQKAADGPGVKLDDVLRMRTGRDWEAVREIVASARRYGLTVEQVTALYDRLGLEELQSLFQYHTQWKEPVDTLVELRRKFTWSDLSQVRAVATKYAKLGLTFQAVTGLCPSGDWDALDRLLALSRDNAVPIERLIVLRAEYPLGELQAIFSYAHDWRLPPEELMKLRKGLSWDHLAAARAQAVERALPVADVCALAGAMPSDQLYTATDLIKRFNLKPAEIVELRATFALDELHSAAKVAQEQKAPLKDALTLRRKGLSWEAVGQVLVRRN